MTSGIPWWIYAGLAFSATCFLAALWILCLLLADELAAYRAPRPGYLHEPSTEAMAAQTDRRSV